jgi:hypothetical protein
MTPDAVKTLVLSFPSTEAGFSYGHPSFKAAGKFFTRIRAEDDSVVVYVDSLDQRDMLIEADPDTFHLTDHYRNYPIVLARIGSVDPDWLSHALEARWRRLVPRSVSKAWDARPT